MKSKTYFLPILLMTIIFIFAHKSLAQKPLENGALINAKSVHALDSEPPAPVVLPTPTDPTPPTTTPDPSAGITKVVPTPAELQGPDSGSGSSVNSIAMPAVIDPNPITTPSDSSVTDGSALTAVPEAAQQVAINFIPKKEDFQKAQSNVQNAVKSVNNAVISGLNNVSQSFFAALQPANSSFQYDSYAFTSEKTKKLNEIAALIASLGVLLASGAIQNLGRYLAPTSLRKQKIVI